MDGQGTKCHRNIAENYNRLSRVHEHYRQTDRRQTDGQQHIANVNASSRLLKMKMCSSKQQSHSVTNIVIPLCSNNMKCMVLPCLSAAEHPQSVVTLTGSAYVDRHFPMSPSDAETIILSLCYQSNRVTVSTIT